jgi:prophage regulatory protein
MKLLSFKEVQVILGGRSRSSIYRDVASKTIPQPYKLAGRVFWRDDEIFDFIKSLTHTSSDSLGVEHVQS